MAKQTGTEEVSQPQMFTVNNGVINPIAITSRSDQFATIIVLGMKRRIKIGLDIFETWEDARNSIRQDLMARINALAIHVDELKRGLKIVDEMKEPGAE